MQRLVNSGRIYYMDNPYSVDQLCDAAAEVVRTNRMKGCYLRPVVLRGYGDVGVSALKNPIEVYIACWEWGAYLGGEALEQGVDVCVSSWARLAPNTLPAMAARLPRNYMNSQLIKMEALAQRLHAKGLGSTHTGHVSEGSGENIFLVLDGKMHTPPLASAGLRRNHAQIYFDAVRGFEHPGERGDDPARNAVRRRRGLLQRHCGGDHSAALD